ncbi:MAG: hypothetical protein ABIH18_00225 [Candidatus Omnitrophota bacterium]
MEENKKISTGTLANYCFLSFIILMLLNIFIPIQRLNILTLMILYILPTCVWIAGCILLAEHKGYKALPGILLSLTSVIGLIVLFVLPDRKNGSSFSKNLHSKEHLILLSISLILVIVNLYLLLKILPYHLNIYRNLGMMLPLPTQIVINISYFIKRSSFLAALIVIPATIILLNFSFSIENKKSVTRIYSILLGLLLISALLIHLAIKLPIMEYKKILHQLHNTPDEIDTKIKELFKRYK